MISSTTFWNLRWRGFCPSVRQTLQKEQCLGQPRMVCTEAHIYFCGIHQVPARGEEFAALDAAAFVDFFGLAGEAIGDDLCPGEIAVAFDDGVCFAALERFLRKQRGVNSAVDDPGAAGARHAADRVAAQGVAGVDADADDVAGLNGLGHNLLERFIDENGISDDGGRGGGKHEEPARRDDRGAKGIVAGIDEMNAQADQPFAVLVRLASQQFRGCRNAG